LVLRELQGFSYQEIADAMRCSIGTVMSRLFHARRRMQALLEAERPPQALAA
jgi:RNA polymerase sigma-70 factor (ECF subfamily)